MYLAHIILSFFCGAEEDRGNPRGIVPIWRARSVTEYKADLLPMEPIPIPVKESEESMLDILDYLQQQYGLEGPQAAEEEGAERHHLTSPVPPELLIPDAEDVPPTDTIN